MNRIVFAGRCEGLERADKCLEIIIPAENGDGGTVVSENLTHSYGWREILIIPPFCKYRVEGGSENDLHILIEQPMLAFKGVDIMTDVDGDGIRRAGEQAEIFMRSEWNNRGQVLDALGNLLVSYAGLYYGESEKISPVTAQVKAEIDKNISDPLFSVDMLKRLPLNYDYIRKLFKKETGATPHAYLLHRRMELASAIIAGRVSNRYSNYTVAQIAEACGFSEPLYFSRVFKKYFGVSPTEYAKDKGEP